jgi:iron-sulfur cluster assembly protein
MIIKKDTQCPVVITPEALSHIRQIIYQKTISTDTYGLRIGMKGGGCAGSSFLLGFDTPKSADQRYQVEEIPVFIEKKHLMYVLGLVLDYQEGEESGFVFNNKEAERQV